MARRGLSISGLSLESKYEAIMRFLRRGYRYFALHDTIVGIRPIWSLARNSGVQRQHGLKLEKLSPGASYQDFAIKASLGEVRKMTFNHHAGYRGFFP
jgi:hypothetical protein